MFVEVRLVLFICQETICKFSCRTKHGSYLIEKYCRWVPYYDGNEVLCLKEKDNFDCIFWENGCVVYNARPLQCSSYPFWDFLLKDKKSWDNAAKTCPGMNNGEFHSYEEINKTVKAYRQNIPLKKVDLKSFKYSKSLKYQVSQDIIKELKFY